MIKNVRTLQANIHQWEAKELGGGFKQSWVTGKNEDIDFELTSGAGLGNAYLELSVKYNGTTIRECIDIGEFVTAWVDAICNTHEPS